MLLSLTWVQLGQSVKLSSYTFLYSAEYIIWKCGDEQVGMKNGLSTVAPVDDSGLFTKEAGESFIGKSVLGDGNTAVLEALKDTPYLLKVILFIPSYIWRIRICISRMFLYL